MHILIRLNRFFHWGKNRNRSNRFIAIFCDLLRFIAIYCDFLRFCDFFLGNQIRHQEKTEEDCKDKQTKRSTAFNGFPLRYSRKFKIDRVESYRMTHH